MQKVNSLITQLENYIPVSDKKNIAVSSQNVAWHIYHSLLVLKSICLDIQTSQPENYKWKFNFWRLVVMGKNKIPRGKGKAPSRVLPREEVTIDLIKSTLEETKKEIEKLKTLSANHYFRHPFFGDLNMKPSIKFLALHTQHHVDIIKDILA